LSARSSPIKAAKRLSCCDLMSGWKLGTCRRQRGQHDTLHLQHAVAD
jgi:hypothetical protein